VKRILIEWLHHDGEKHSYAPSAEVLRVISHAIETIRPFLSTMQTQLDFKEIGLTADEMALSGAIKINGKEIDKRGDGILSEETLIDAVLRETVRFTGKGCAGNPEDLSR